MKGRPNSRKNLDLAIERLADSRDEGLRLRRIFANTVVAQMMPRGAVKGGSAMRIRFGYAATRFSTDLDTARAGDVEAFVSDFAGALKDGWNGFSGRVVALPQAKPKGVPAGYVMQPYDVKLDYNGKPWLTVKLEVGHNEIGDADSPDYFMSEEIAELFGALGFPPPNPIPLMQLKYQIAQKLHGASEPESSRAHDLVDLQVIMAEGDIDLKATRDVCRRLFAYRRMQAWPSTVRTNDRWDELYNTAKEDLPVLPTVVEAVDWTNRLISQIEHCEND